MNTFDWFDFSILPNIEHWQKKRKPGPVRTSLSFVGMADQLPCIAFDIDGVFKVY